MANCYGCPYRWHDSDCEYCSAKGDEIIDGKSYSKETCGIYKAYKESQGSGSSSSSSSYSPSSSSSSSSSSSGNGGCIGCAVVIVILALILTLISSGTLSFGKAKSDKISTTGQTAVVYNVDEAANMRDKPGGDNKLITSIPKGETVEIIKKDGKWWLVKYGEYEGYCNSKYLDIQD